MDLIAKSADWLAGWVFLWKGQRRLEIARLTKPGGSGSKTGTYIIGSQLSPYTPLRKRQNRLVLWATERGFPWIQAQRVSDDAFSKRQKLFLQAGRKAQVKTGTLVSFIPSHTLHKGRDARCCSRHGDEGLCAGETWNRRLFKVCSTSKGGEWSVFFEGGKDCFLPNDVPHYSGRPHLVELTLCSTSRSNSG